MTTKYFTRAGNFDWKPCKASTLEAAKRVATRRRGYQGTSVYVGSVVFGDVRSVAVKHADPIDMNRVDGWREVEPLDDCE